MLAQSQKAGYIAAETAKLKTLYDSAVALYDRGAYAEAIERFRSLMETNPEQVGYEEFYRPNAGAIQQYLEDAMDQNAASRVARIVSLSEESKFSVWITGNWMAQFGEIGLTGTYLSYTETGLTRVPIPGLQKLAPKSFPGGDVGVSFRVTDFLWTGASWSQIVLTPYGRGHPGQPGRHP